MDLANLKTKTIRTAHRIAKTRLAPFFRDPHNMIELREELERRNNEDRNDGDVHSGDGDEA